MSDLSAAAHLRAFIERIERIQEEIDGLNGDKRDVFAEAKAMGFDTKALKAIIARRRREPDELAEHDAIVELYLAALDGADLHVQAHVREAASPQAGKGH